MYISFTNPNNEMFRKSTVPDNNQKHWFPRLC